MEEGEAKIDSFHHSVKCNKIIMCNAQSILIKSNYTCISVYIQIHPCISHRYLCIYKQMFKKYMHELVPHIPTALSSLVVTERVMLLPIVPLSTTTCISTCLPPSLAV